MVAAEAEGLVRGAVLDAGCGTGENALHMASRGHEVVGIDVAGNAIEAARRTAVERGLAADFRLGDILDDADLGRTFGTVIDVGCFHALTDEQRPLFAEVLARVLEPGGRYLMACFSERVPGTFGPRRVTAEEIRTTFAEDDGWHVAEVRDVVLETAIESRSQLPAYLAVVERR